MTRSYLALIGLLAAIWGASYLFIKVAVRDFAPAAMMELRLAGAGIALALFLVFQRGFRSALADLRGVGWQGFAIGVVNGAIPYTLIAWGERHIDSGIAAVANATVPLFNALLVPFFLPRENVTGMRLVGIVFGLVGVTVLTAGQPQVSWWFIVGTMAVIVASLSYAVGVIWAQHSLASSRGPALAAASMLGGAVALLPFALFRIPDHAPAWKPVASLVALTLFGTVFAQLILYRAIRLHGSARTSLVTFLMPPIALVYGAVLLSEPITVASVAGLGLIVFGILLGAGALRWNRPTPGPAP